MGPYKILWLCYELRLGYELLSLIASYVGALSAQALIPHLKSRFSDMSQVVVLCFIELW